MIISILIVFVKKTKDGAKLNTFWLDAKNGDARPATPLPTNDSDTEFDAHDDDDGDDTIHDGSALKKVNDGIDAVREELKKVPRAYTPISDAEIDSFSRTSSHISHTSS